MKTLVVLSALVSLAIAAPAQPGEGLEDAARTQNWHIQAQPSLPELVRREKKSPSDITSTSHHTGAATTEDLNVHIDSTPTARSFALKKPLIVRKNHGYRLYRDSEEEKAHADPNETCGRQVKVKLCEEKQSPTHEMINNHMAEDDVKNSIRMAKEAVENLQRDLKKMETTSTMKTAHESETDTELNEDIEVARQALEHIHENFGNLESMSLHATTSRNSDIVQDVHVTVAKTEEERMAQWKEAMANIQRNVEIVRNIEDSFKTENNQDNLGHFEDLETTVEHKPEENVNSHALASHDSQMRASEIEHMKLHHHNIEENDNSHAPLHHDSHLRDTEIEQLNMPQKNIDDKSLNKETKENLGELVARQNIEKDEPLNKETKENLGELVARQYIEEDKSLNKNTKEHLEEFVARQNTEEDMNPAASSVIETQVDEIKSQEFLRSEGVENLQHEKKVQEKSEDNLAEIKDLGNKESILDHHVQEKASDLDMDMLTGKSEHHISQVPLMKTVEEETETKLNMEKDNSFKSAEHIHEINKDKNLNTDVTSGHIIKPSTLETFSESQRRSELREGEDKTEQPLNHEKNIWDATDDIIDFLVKSADHSDHEKNIKPEHEEHLMENSNIKPKEAAQSQSLLVEKKEQEKLDHMHKSAEQLDLANLNITPEIDENFMSEKSAVNAAIHDLTKQQMVEPAALSNMDTQTTIKSADEHLHHLEHMHTGHMHGHMQNTHWAHEHGHLDHLSSMKAAEENNKDLELTHGHRHGIIPEKMDHLRYSHLVEHGQIPNELGVDHDFEMSSHQLQHHPHHPTRFHNSMPHSHMHEMSGPMHSNFHPSMRDAMEGFGSDHMFRWKPSHESARGAYGSGLSGSIGSGLSGGAVGVFPNANTGGCGIPLLLSCSPSVVSGSLAKPAHSGGGLGGPGSYSSSAYRSEDEFGFHNKRDIKKTIDRRTSNTLRTQTIVKQKSPILHDSKL